jgi:hypothetical protein
MQRDKPCKKIKVLQRDKHSLYLKSAHALLLNILSYPHFKILKFLKKFCKTLLKNPKCFGHYCLTILRGRPLYVVHYHFSAFWLRHLPIRYVALCRLCVCVSDVPVCGLSGRDRPDWCTMLARYVSADGIHWQTVKFVQRCCLLLLPSPLGYETLIHVTRP